MTNRKAYSIVGLVILLVTVACGTNNSDAGGSPKPEPDLLATMRERGYMNAGVATYAPYAFLDSDGAAAGIFVDMTDEIAKRLEIPEVNYVVMSSAGFVPALDSGRIDTLPGYSKTDERAQVADFSDPVMYLPDCMMVRADSGITTLEQLDGKVLGLTRGSYAETVAQNLIDRGVFTPADIVKYDSFEAPIRELADGRVDAGYLDTVGFENGRQLNPSLFNQIDCIPVPPELEGYDTIPPVYYLFPKEGDDTLLQEVNRIVGEMVQDGTTAKIFEKYGLTEPSLITGALD